jgi:hypothetical protein
MNFGLEFNVSRLNAVLLAPSWHFILRIAAVTPHQMRTFGRGSKLGEGAFRADNDQR